MKAKDTGSSDWPEGEPSAEQKSDFRGLPTTNHPNAKGQCTVSANV